MDAQCGSVAARGSLWAGRWGEARCWGEGPPGADSWRSMPASVASTCVCWSVSWMAWQMASCCGCLVQFHHSQASGVLPRMRLLGAPAVGHLHPVASGGSAALAPALRLQNDSGGCRRFFKTRCQCLPLAMMTVEAQGYKTVQGGRLGHSQGEARAPWRGQPRQVAKLQRQMRSLTG